MHAENSQNNAYTVHALTSGIKESRPKPSQQNAFFACRTMTFGHAVADDVSRFGDVFINPGVRICYCYCDMLEKLLPATTSVLRRVCHMVCHQYVY